MFSSVLAHVFYCIVVFVAGALMGQPMYKWVSKKLPWSKDQLQRRGVLKMIDVFPLIEIIVGTGIITMLWQMNQQLGSLAAEMRRFSDMISDHEHRIRKIEGKQYDRYQSRI